MSLYSYEESLGAKHVRLLKLYPGGLEEPIHCSMTTVTTDSLMLGHNPYEALSYTWGSEDHQQTILCDGKLLSITQDLHVALRNLRDTSAPRMLWIDQICINQADLEERSAQVTIMDVVYWSAQRVVVWLGDKTESSYLAIEFAGKLNDAMSAYHHAHPKSTLGVSDFGKILPSTDFFLPPIGGFEWQALGELFAMKWFGRLWIVQEVLANGNILVQCGKTTFPWVTIEHLVSHVSRFGIWAFLIQQWDTKAGWMFVFNISMMREKSPHTTRLIIEGAISLFALQDAKIAHDRVYGVLSLLDETERSLVKPDYKKSAAEIYMELTRAILETKKRKNILNQVELNVEQSGVGAPSWVPDWTCQPHSGKIKSHPMEWKKYNASKTRGEDWVFTNDGKTLRIRGRQVDSIVSGGHRFRFPDPAHSRIWPLEEALAYIREINQFFVDTRALASSCKRYPNINPNVLLCLACMRGINRAAYGEDPVRLLTDYIEVMQKAQGVLERKLKTLSASTNVDNTLSESSSETKWYETNPNSTSSSSDQSTQVHVPDTAPAENDFARLFTTELINNYISKTDAGFLASLPPQREIGDIVAILYGWETPFLLRPVAAGYLLISECWVLGIMHGEAIEQDLGTEMHFDVV